MRKGALLVIPASAAFSLVAGCGDRGATDAGVIVRDSASVAIVEHRNVVTEELRWIGDDAPVLRIGEMEGDGPEVFGSIGDVLRSPSGELFIVDAMARTIRVFSAEGIHLRDIGRQGEGPGEFSIPRTMALIPGDSLLVEDGLGGRVSIFDPAGTFRRSWPIPRVDGAGAPTPVGVLADGTLVMSALGRPFGEDEGTRSTLLLYTIDLAGAIGSVVGEFPHQDLGGNGFPFVFGSGREIAVGESTIRHGHASRFDVHEITPDGTLLRVVRVNRAPRPVRQEEIDQRQRAAEESLIAQGAQPALIARILDTEYADTHPVHRRLLVDAVGDLWVQRADDPSGVDDGVWDIFDSEGRLRGMLRIPDGTRVVRVGVDYLLGVHADDLGVQRVHLYSLDRS